MSLITYVGLRELPRPKGEGYLYISHDLQSEDKVLAYFNLYKTSDDEFREMLLGLFAKFPEIFSSGNFHLVNFSEFSKKVFDEIVNEEKAHIVKERPNSDFM